MKIAHEMICFDVGGVLVRISQTWQEAVQRAGCSWNRPETAPLLLPACAPMNDYQAGQLSHEEYLVHLAEFLGLTEAEAETVHLSILQTEYPGIPELVADVKSRGCRTAILSNTNALHWDDLLNPSLFPTVATIDAPHASHLIGHGKPDAAIYAEFNRLTGTKPHEVVFFDDSQANVDAARAFGWRSHRIDPWADPAAQMRDFLVNEELL